MRLAFGIGARLLAALTATLPALASAGAADYRLGPQDQLQIRVFDLRTGTGQAYEWQAFNGMFTVNAAGKLSAPLLGEIDAGGQTTAEVARTIADKLKSKVGLAERPDVAVQVTKYRPFYVLGGVDKAGAYEYQPGLTVLQAVSIAGGATRARGDMLLGFERDALTSNGDLRVETAERLGLLVRQARLDAEINNSATISWPNEIKDRLADPDVAQLVKKEQMLFESRADALKSQTQSILETKRLLQSQVESLQAKDAALTKLLDVVKSELDQVSSLFSKGLAVMPRKLEIEQNVAQFQSTKLDVQLAILRTAQDISKADRDVLELTKTRRNEELQQSTETRNKLTEISEKMETARRLLVQAEVRGPSFLASQLGEAAHPSYSLTRVVNGAAETRAVNEGDEVEPGDVLRVEFGAKQGARADTPAKADSNASPSN